MSIGSIPGLSGLANVLSNGQTSSTSGSTSSNSSTASSSSSSGTTSLTGTSKLSALAQFDLQQLQTTQTSINGYTQFSQLLSELQGTLLGVVAVPFATALSGVSSSDTGVAYISPSAGTNYAVDVSQLAQPQQLTTQLTAGQTSNSTSDPGTQYSNEVYDGGGTITIQTGDVDTGTGKFTATGQPTQITVAAGTHNDTIDGNVQVVDNLSLQGIADAINNGSTGVSASVVTDSSGNYQLQITGSNSGQSSGFTVAGVDAGTGGGTGSVSLNTLTYNATTTTNYSAEPAQDAQYTVNGQQFASPTNLNVPVAAGVNINLLTTGSTVISTPQAPTNVVNAANSLVSTINGLFQSLAQLAAGPLASDTSVVTQFQSDATLALSSTFGTGTEQTLSQLGITIQADGTYTVNTNQLSEAFAQDPTGTENVLSQAASALMQAAQQFNGQYGLVTNQLTALQSQQTLYTGELQVDSQTTSTQAATAQAQSAVNAYNLLSESSGGSASPLTSLFG